MQAEETLTLSPPAQSQIAPVNVAFGRRLRALRKRRNISQSDFASRVGVSRVTVASLEAGKQNVKLEQIFAFAVALDAPVDRLIPSANEVDCGYINTRVRSDCLMSTDFEFLETARAILVGRASENEP